MYIKKIRQIGLLFLLSIIPSLLYAATGVQDIIDKVKRWVGTGIPVISGLALLAFGWGIAKYIFRAGEEKEEGKKIMIWGVIALFVLFSIYGIVNLIATELSVDNTGNFNSPCLKGAGIPGCP